MRDFILVFSLCFAIACEDAPVTGGDASQCGDGVVDPGEGCDDGNTLAGDGCDSQCVPGADGDGDGVADEIDNCAELANPAQADQDGDGLGDDCDEQPEQRNFRLRRSGPLVLVHGGNNAAHQLQGQVAGHGQMSAASDQFQLKGGFHVVLPPTP